MTEPLQEQAAAPASVEEPVGATLARAREAAGLGLEEAARRLKFAPRQLDALERGEWGRLPGGAAVRGMVRNYARLLELDADALVARAAQAFPDADQLAQRFRQPVPFSDGSRRSNLAYVALSLGLLVVVAAVVIEWRQERADASRLTFVSAAQQPAEPGRAEPVRPEPVRPEPVRPEPARPEAARPEPVRPQPARVEVASAAPPAAPVTAAPTAAEEAASAVGQKRLELRFERESWVEIHSGTGKLLVAQLHPAGSERVVSGLPPFSLVIGNAQHVQVFYDGDPVDLKPHIKVEVARFTLE